MSRLTTVLFLIVLAATTLAWLFTVATTLTLHQSDQAGNGMSYSFAGIGVGVTWILMGVVLLMSFGRVEKPSWVLPLAILAFVLSAVAAITVINLLKDDATITAQWPIITLIGAPVLMMSFAVWCASPSMQRFAEPRTMFAGVWGAALALSVLPFPFRAIQKRQLAARQDAYVASQASAAAGSKNVELAELSALGDSAHLRVYLSLASNNTEVREAVLMRVSSLPHRQRDAIEMLNAGEGIAMGELRNLSLEATPELCSSSNTFLQKHATDIGAKRNNANPRFEVAEQDLEKYEYGMQWLAERRCDVRPALLAYRETAMAYAESPERARYIKKLEDIAARSGHSLDSK